MTNFQAQPPSRFGITPEQQRFLDLDADLRKLLKQEP